MVEQSIHDAKIMVLNPSVALSINQIDIYWISWARALKVEQSTHSNKIKGLNLATYTAEKDLKKSDVLLK